MDVFNAKLDNKLTASPQIWARFPNNIIAGALQSPTLGILNFISWIWILEIESDCDF